MNAGVSRSRKETREERESERERELGGMRTPYYSSRVPLSFYNTEIRFVCRFVTRERRSKKSSSFEAGKGLFVLRISDDAFECCFFCVVVLAGMTVLVGDLAGTRILLAKIRARKRLRLSAMSASPSFLIPLPPSKMKN